MRVVWYRCRKRKTGKMQECVCKCFGAKEETQNAIAGKRYNRKNSSRVGMYKAKNVYKIIMTGPNRKDV